MHIISMEFQNIAVQLILLITDLILNMNMKTLSILQFGRRQFKEFYHQHKITMRSYTDCVFFCVNEIFHRVRL